MSPLFKHDKDKKNDKDADQSQDWLLPADARPQLEQMFKSINRDVVLEVFTRDKENEQFTEYALRFAKDLDRLSPKITAKLQNLDSDRAKELGAEISPTIFINPDEYRMSFRGAPVGEEARSLIQGIMLAATGESGLSDQSKQILSQLKEPRKARVFVSPTCPYCPGQVVNAFKAAVERPDLVSAECVETSENAELSASFGVGSVPHTQFTDTYAQVGLMDEVIFCLELVLLEKAKEVIQKLKSDNAQDQVVETDLVIIGAGPAGLTAAIYAERSGMKTVVLEKSVVGGQVAITPVVENYPAYDSVPGKRLMDIMANHARQYADIHEEESVEELKVGKRIEVLTSKAVYSSGAVILATGAVYRKLGVPGEERYFGAGVNYCASCDGYLYRSRRVAVVGGGNTALTDALHLKNLGVEVFIVHRRGEFRAEKHLQDSVEREGIECFMNSVVQEILGDKDKVTGIRLENVGTHETQDKEVDGVFIAVGHDPASDLAKQIGLKLTPEGFIEVDKSMRTSIPRIYAAGDIVGGVMQIVTAVGAGAAAALAAFEDARQPYWARGES
ncbi:MAG: thioredoxin reductase [Desulfovibrionales bacterium]|nr:thioredoxin reductase [Desulfovibrionales bacterium]